MKICVICGEEFDEIQPHQVYCSKKCRNKNASIKTALAISEKRKKAFEEKYGTTRRCKICNEEFELQQQHPNKMYCSNKCKRKAEYVFGSKKELGLNYKDELRFGGNRTTVLIRDNYECQMCGSKKNLVVHHKDGSGQSETVNNKLDNLVTLCRKCHINIHRLDLVSRI